MDFRINIQYQNICNDMLIPYNKIKIMYIFCLYPDIYMFFLWNKNIIKIFILDKNNITNIPIIKVVGNTYYTNSENINIDISTINIVKNQNNIYGVINKDSKKIFLSIYDKDLSKSILNIYNSIY